MHISSYKTYKIFPEKNNQQDLYKSLHCVHYSYKYIPFKLFEILEQNMIDAFLITSTQLEKNGSMR